MKSAPKNKLRWTAAVMSGLAVAAVGLTVYAPGAQADVLSDPSKASNVKTRDTDTVWSGPLGLKCEVRTGTYNGKSYAWGRMTKGRTGEFKELKNGVGMKSESVSKGSGQTHYSRGVPLRKNYTYRTTFFDGKYRCKAEWTYK
ncbi:hypothetical protein AB0I81_52150 [Nonomuraea sp. NPDC050404]|uniref:hypothetical protein n=1 Tax=Nonomuraea sp. NPDC050404 TaxID=3155783 RepID=UPI0033DDF4A9